MRLQPKHRARLTPLGLAIRTIMERQELKHKLLAERAGIGLNTLTHAMYRNPTVAGVTAIAEALDVDLYELFLPPELDIPE